IEDRAVRAKVEREADKRAAELKREAQQAAQAATRSTRAAKVAASEDLPPQLRGVRVVRDGKVVHGAAPKGLDNAERAGNATVKEGAAVRTQEREIRVGDRVRLSTFGSVGIVDQIKGTEAQVRVGSLHLREKLMNLELIDDTQGSSSNLKEGSLEQMQ